MALRLLLPLLLTAAALFITQAQGISSSAPDCCLLHSQKPIPYRMVKSYRFLGPETGCELRSVVFTTKKNRKICASPTDPNMKKLIEKLNNKPKTKKKQSPGAKSRNKRQKQQQV
ncbi:C-C motif chemokine 19-like [Colius striatus]|uniref:C-C motif chemokine 19-like n=1 Tax=Colius striatus TaxID=57412 RepID=UPI000529DAB8|nr:C-C motif chemokine 19-like [Colius striatus]